jgi:predicted acylesterase/phospholipase RssA/tetratricopeptide (TPR) repeat protein/ankyrin repeat protein
MNDPIEKPVSEQDLISTDSQMARQLQSEEFDKISSDKSFESSINKKLQVPQKKEDKWEIDVPADNSCLFWAAALAYLLPVINNKNEFKARFISIFGEGELNQSIGILSLLKTYNPFSNTFLFVDSKLNYLIREQFRKRVIEYIASAEQKEHFRPFWDSGSSTTQASFEEYLSNMQHPDSWAGNLEIRAISQLLDCNVNLITGYEPQKFATNSSVTITLVHVNAISDSRDKNHYHFYLDSNICQFNNESPRIFAGQVSIVPPQLTSSSALVKQDISESRTNEAPSMPVGNIPKVPSGTMKSPLVQHNEAKDKQRTINAYNLPLRNKDFVGRGSQLDKLKSLTKNTQSVIKQNIVGQGGVGKSQLAYEYANWAYEEKIYDWIIVLDASTDLIGEFKKYANDPKQGLGLEVDNLTNTKLLDKVYGKLSNKSVLLVLDDVENFDKIANEKILPEINKLHNSQCIITSRSQHWGRQFDIISLDIFDEREALIYLKKMLDLRPEIYNEDDAKVLVNDLLGCLPLAITQAAAFMVNTCMSIVDYIKSFKENQSDAKELLKDIPPDDPHEKTIYTTIKIILNELKTKSSQAIEVLRYMSFFSSRFIPKIFFTDILKLGNVNFSKIVKLCNDYSLFENDQTAEYLRIHPLTQTIVRIKIGEKEKEPYVERLFDIFINLYPNNILSRGELWAIQSILFTHVLQFNDYINQIALSEKYEVSMLLLLNGIIEHIITVEEVSYPKALKFIQHVREINEKNKEIDLDSYSKIHRSMEYSEARIKIKIGKAKEGLEQLLKLLPNFTKEDKEENLKKQSVLFEIAKAYMALDDYMALDAIQEAEKYLKQASTLPASYHSLGGIRYSQSKYYESEQLYRRALQMKIEQYRTSEHSQVAVTMVALAHALAVQGKFKEAIKSSFEAVNITSKVHGTKYHESIIHRKNVYIDILYRAGNYKDALNEHNALMEIEYVLNKSSNGSSTSSPTLTSTFTTAKLFIKLGYYFNAFCKAKEAEDAYNKWQVEKNKPVIKKEPILCIYLGHSLAVLEWFEAAEYYLEEALFSLSDNGKHAVTHNYTTAYLYFGDLLIRKNEWEAARAVLEKNLKLQRECYNHTPNHPHLAFTLRNLALVYRAYGEFKLALEILNETLAIQHQIYEMDKHVEVLITQRDILAAKIHQAKDLSNLNIYIHELQNIINLQKEVYDNEEKDEIAKSYQLLAQCYQMQDKVSDAILQQRKAVDVLKKIFIHEELKQDHSSVINAKDYLLSLYCKQGDLTNAILISEELVEVLPDRGNLVGNLACLYHIKAIHQNDSILKSGDVEKTEKLFRRALKYTSKPEIYCDLAIFLYQQARYIDAIKELNNALEFMTDDENNLIYTEMEKVRLDFEMQKLVGEENRELLLSAKVMVIYLLIRISLEMGQQQVTNIINTFLNELINQNNNKVNKKIFAITQRLISSSKLGSLVTNVMSLRAVDKDEIFNLFSYTLKILGDRAMLEEIKSTEIILRNSAVARMISLCKETENPQASAIEVVKEARSLLLSDAKIDAKKAMSLVLFTAASSQNNAVVQSLLRENLVDPNATDDMGNTLLHVAAATSNAELFDFCKTIIKHSAKNNLEQNILHVAVVKNRADILKEAIRLQLSVVEQAKFLLQSSSFALNTSMAISMQSLHYAVYAGHIDCIKVLLSAKELTEDDIRLEIPGLGNLIHIAIAGGHKEVIEMLLSDKRVQPLINKRNSLNFSPVGAAAYSAQIDILQLLVDRGAKLVLDDRATIPTLACAAYACNRSILIKVLQYFQNHPEALKWNLNAKFEIAKLPKITAYGIREDDQEKSCTVLRLVQKLAEAINRPQQGDLTILQRQQMAAEWSGMAGLLENLETQINSASFNDDAEKEQVLATIRELINTVQQSVGKARYKNIVLQGGGPKGIAYIGAIQCLEEALGSGLPSIRRIAGTSAGAITSLLLALGFKSEEIRQKLAEKKLTDFIEGSFDPEKVRLASNSLSLKNIFKATADIIYKKYQKHRESESLPKAAFHALVDSYYMEGLCPGEDFRKWLETVLTERTGIEYLTFGELHDLANRQPDKSKGVYYKDLCIVTTQLLPKPSIHIISSENQSEEIKDLVISDAIRASMSIPGVFSPHRLRFKKSGKLYVIEDNYYVDGGLLCNYAIQIFDNVQYHPFGFGQRNTASFQLPNRETLGLSLYTPEELTEKPIASISNVKELLKSLGNIYNDAENIYAQLQRPIDAERTIRMSNLGVGLFDFDIPTERKGKEVTQGDLIQEGYDKTRTFLIRQQIIVAPPVAKAAAKPSVVPAIVRSNSPLHSLSAVSLDEASKRQQVFHQFQTLQQNSLVQSPQLTPRQSIPKPAAASATETLHQSGPLFEDGAIEDLTILDQEMVKSGSAPTYKRINIRRHLLMNVSKEQADKVLENTFVNAQDEQASAAPQEGTSRKP